MPTTFTGFYKTVVNKPVLHSKHKHTCDCCHQSLHWHELVLLRDEYALPEEPTIYLHESCVSRYVHNHCVRWHQIDRDSHEAGWLV